MTHLCPVHHITGVDQPGPQGRHELRPDQSLEVQEGEDQVQDVPQVSGRQPVNNVLAMVDQLNHFALIFFPVTQFLSRDKGILIPTLLTFYLYDLFIVITVMNF